MGELRQYIARLQTITVQQQEEQALAIVKAHEPTALDLNISQLMAGRDSNGEELFPPYSDPYAQFKKELGLPYDRVTLNLTGDFYRGFFLTAEKFPIILGSRDEKADRLAINYGGAIFGLDTQSLEEFNKLYILEDIQAYYRSLLLLR
jgi:hypothetical protein